MNWLVLYPHDLPGGAHVDLLNALAEDEEGYNIAAARLSEAIAEGLRGLGAGLRAIGSTARPLVGPTREEALAALAREPRP